MRKSGFILTIIIIVFLLASCNQQNDNTYEINETYRITSSAGTKSLLSVDLPISYGYQRVEDIKVENVDNYSFEQKDGYQTLLAEIKGDGTEKEIIVTYEITLLNGISDWIGDSEDQYLDSGEFIDSDNQKIVDVAKSLIIEGDKFKTAKNISEYVSKNIDFDDSIKTNQKTNLASEILESKKGVCGDYANLTTALLRASGIPAKSISGLVLDNLKTSADWASPAGSHAWVEFFVDGKWYFDDPTWGNKYFASTDGFHLSYGTQSVSLDSQEFQDFINEIENRELTVLGAMTAPIKFASWSEDQNAIITPKVEIINK